MTGQQTIIYCSECDHCFESKRSRTGYACEVWGYDDFAAATEPSGFCHKAKPKSRPNTVSLDAAAFLQKTMRVKGE